MSLGKRLRKLCDAEETETLVLFQRAGHRPDLPLLIIVHPGDITEHNSILGTNIRNRSLETQGHVAELMKTWVGELIILHRQSCIEFLDQRSCALPRLSKALRDARCARAGANNETVIIAYGDDLPAFCETIRPFVEDRPRVLVTGAYKDPKHGCVDKVASLLGRFSKVEIDPLAYTAP